MELITPEFLNHVEISKVDLQRIAPNLKNWGTVSRSYSKISLEELEKYILVELNFKCRPSYIERMMMRYNKLQQKKIDTFTANDNSEKQFYKIVESFQ